MQSISLRCEKHHRDFILFCYKVDCKKLVCSACLAVERRNHEFKGIEDVTEERRKSVLNRLDIVQHDLQSNKEKLRDIRKTIEEKSTDCVDSIKQHTEELLKQLSETSIAYIKKVHEQKRESQLEIDKIVRKIDGMIDTMDGLKKTAENTNMFHEITTCMNSVGNFSTFDLMMPFKVFHHYTYEKTSVQKPIENCLGTLLLESCKSSMAKKTQIDPTRTRPSCPVLGKAQVAEEAPKGVDNKIVHNPGVQCELDPNVVVKRELYVSVEPLKASNDLLGKNPLRTATKPHGPLTKKQCTNSISEGCSDSATVTADGNEIPLSLTGKLYICLWG